MVKDKQAERDERVLQDEWLKLQSVRREAARHDLAARPTVR